MINAHVIRPFATVSAIALLASAVLAAPPKAAAKPKPKPKPASTQLASKGTSQLPGAWCDFGKSYTLGKGDSAINFCINSAEYKVQRVKTGDSYTLANAGRKLLVLHGFVHNCLSQERWVSNGTLNVTAVDGDSQNADLSAICIESTGKHLDQTMKPAQKIECYVVLDITGKGEIPKLMVANSSDPSAPVARYDLKGKVGKVEELFRDPADKTGATALDEVACKIGTVYELSDLNIKVESVEVSTKAFPDQELAEDSANVVVTYESTSFCDTTKYLSGGNVMYEVKLIDVDGVTYEESIRSLAGSSDREVSFELNLGKTIRYRNTFVVPKGIKLKSLTLKNGEGRTLVIDMSAFKS